MEAVTKLGRWWVGALVLAGGALAVVLWPRSAPVRPVAAPSAPAPAVAAPTAPRVAPKRAVTCLASFEDIRVSGHEPVICNTATCMRPPGDEVIARSATLAADGPPLAARVRLGGRPAACDDDRCAPLGRKLATAAAREAAHDAPVLQATLDLSTAVIGRQIWSIARDAPLAPRRPAYEPNEKILDLRVAGDLVIVHWGGACRRMGGVNPDCQRSYLVNARGAVLDDVDPEDGVLRVGPAAFVTLSATTGIAVHDLHTGKAIAHTWPPYGFLVAVPLDTDREGRFAVRRGIDNGELLEVYELEWGRLSVTSQRYYASCE